MTHTISPAAGLPPPTAAEEVDSVARKSPLSASTWRCGHPKTPENTRRVGMGEVRCRACRSIIDQRSRQRKRERAA